MQAAAATICHFRSILSAIKVPSSGLNGLAAAMMNEYSRLVVMWMPLAISNDGTQEANP